MPEKPLPRIVVFGDSIAWGSYDVERGGWVERIKQHFLQTGVNEDYVAVYNAGVSGDRTGDVLKRFDSEIAARAPRWGESITIVIAIGINDASDEEGPCTPLPTFKDQYAEIAAKALAVTSDVILLSPTNVVDGYELNHANSQIEQYVQIIESIGTDKSLQYVNLFGILGKNDVSDGLHPNAVGHEKIAQAVLPLLGIRNST